MFNNIGKKISGLAKFVAIVGIILSVLAGLLFVAIGLSLGITASVLLGVLIILIGSISSWAGSLALYGFGTLIDKTDDTNATLRKMVEE